MIKTIGRIRYAMLCSTLIAVLATGAVVIPVGGDTIQPAQSVKDGPVDGYSMKIRPALAAAETYYLAHTPKATMGWWERDPWTADDRAYQAAKLSIYNTVTQAKGQEAAVAASLVHSCRADAQSHRFKPLPAFRYGYAVCLAKHYNVALYRGSITKGDFQDDLFDAGRQLEELPAPHNYEVSRILFLVRVARQATNQLTLLGERLLARNPHDFAVQAGLVRMLQPSFSQADKRLALLCGQDIVQQTPTSPYGYSVLASVHYRLWEHSNFKNQRDGAEAIKLYTRAIAMLPKGDPLSARFNEIITEIEKHP